MSCLTFMFLHRFMVWAPHFAVLVLAHARTSFLVRRHSCLPPSVLVPLLEVPPQATDALFLVNAHVPWYFTGCLHSSLHLCCFGSPADTDLWFVTIPFSPPVGFLLHGYLFHIPTAPVGLSSALVSLPRGYLWLPLGLC